MYIKYLIIIISHNTKIMLLALQLIKMAFSQPENVIFCLWKLQCI